MKYKKMIIAGTLLSVIGLASAQTEEAYYVSGKLTYAEHKAKNMDTSARPGIGAFVSGDNSKKYTSGSLALGYQFASDWRVEGEYTIPKKMSIQVVLRHFLRALIIIKLKHNVLW